MCVFVLVQDSRSMPAEAWLNRPKPLKVITEPPAEVAADETGGGCDFADWNGGWGADQLPDWAG